MKKKIIYIIAGILAVGLVATGMISCGSKDAGIIGGADGPTAIFVGK